MFHGKATSRQRAHINLFIIWAMPWPHPPVLQRLSSFSDRNRILGLDGLQGVEMYLISRITRRPAHASFLTQPQFREL